MKNLRLTTLETRRTRGDLIQVFKNLKGFVDVDRTNLFILSNTNLGGHYLMCANLLLDWVVVSLYELVRSTSKIQLGVYISLRLSSPLAGYEVRFSGFWVANHCKSL